MKLIESINIVKKMIYFIDINKNLFFLFFPSKKYLKQNDSKTSILAVVIKNN